MINTCVVCGKQFEAIKSTKKYCSDECSRAGRRIRYAERRQQEGNTRKSIYEKQNNCPEKACLLCGKIFKPKTPSASQRSCCYDCMPDGQQLKRGDFLAKMKQQRGGRCERCGYSACIKALEFHHLDPSKKDFTISNGNFKLKEAIEESKKCVLICANCHRELHDNLWSIEELNLEEKEEVESDGTNT